MEQKVRMHDTDGINGYSKTKKEGFFGENVIKFGFNA